MILISSTYPHISIPAVNVTIKFNGRISNGKWSVSSVYTFFRNCVLHDVLRCCVLTGNLLINYGSLSLRLLTRILTCVWSLWLLYGNVLRRIKLTGFLNKTKISIYFVITRTLWKLRWLHLNLLHHGKIF